MEDRVTLLGRLQRYEKALTDIANIDPGETQNTAVIIARKTLVEEHLGELERDRDQWDD